MNGRQRDIMNAQIWGNYNDSNYDGKRMYRDFQFRNKEISGCLIFLNRGYKNYAYNKK